MSEFKTLAGVLPIVHTPFTDADAIDEESLRRQLDWAFDTGANGCGTGMVSEILRLTTAERAQLGHLIPEIVDGRGPVFASCGAENTAQAVTWAKEAEAAGNDALMAIPPTLTGLPAPEVQDYFTAIAEATDLPIIVQDASAYVGQAIPLEVHVNLLGKFGPDKILFKPEAAPLGPNLSALRDATGGEARIFEGSGGILLIDSFRRGITGTMPGMDLLDGIVEIWRALNAGEEARAYEVHFPISALTALQMQAGLDGYLAVEKYLLKQRGLFATEYRRRPYKWELDGETRAEVGRLFDRLRAVLAD
jgi:dihydrodipicolinate synthase/N-acetylneuraminate lyase